MAITISYNSKELVSSLIKKEFHAINFDLEHIYKKGENLIRAAREYGLTELADELNEIYEFEVNNL